MNMITKRYHWIFDAAGVPKELTMDEKVVTEALKDIAKILEMRIVAGPFVSPGVPSNPGLSAICVVDFSHISIHTFSEPRELCIDVFSCKPFDPEKVRQYLLDTFRVRGKNVVFFEVMYPTG